MWNQKPHITDEKLDRLGDELLRAFDASDLEINTAAASPFLYRRIRARIEAEERQRSEERSSWFALLQTARQSLPALALLAALAASWHWVAPEPAATSEAGLELSLDLPNDDVDATLVGWNNGDAPQRPQSEDKQ
jgi:hypothetical protein